jgi:hypothetical protein
MAAGNRPASGCSKVLGRFRRVWVAQWWENGARRSKVLGRFAHMSKSQAETLLAATLRPINEGTAPAARPVLTFGEFVESAYFQHCQRTRPRFRSSRIIL